MNRPIQQGMNSQYSKLYESGLTVKCVAERAGVSVGKMHKRLVAAGTAMRSPGICKGYKHTGAALEAIRRGNKKRIITDEMREIMRANGRANACNYNGLNGFGHTKPHNKGYVRAYVPRHPNAAKDGYVMLHTVLMERNIGRYLHSDEVVHHINGVKSDNSISNLKLMKMSEHQAMHMKQRHKARRDALSIAS